MTENQRITQRAWHMHDRSYNDMGFPLKKVIEIFKNQAIFC